MATQDSNGFNVTDFNPDLQKRLVNTYLEPYIEDINTARQANLQAQINEAKAYQTYKNSLAEDINRGNLETVITKPVSNGFGHTKYVSEVRNLRDLPYPIRPMRNRSDYGTSYVPWRINLDREEPLATAVTRGKIYGPMWSANEAIVSQTEKDIDSAKDRLANQENGLRNRTISALNNPAIRKFLLGAGIAGEASNLADYGLGNKNFNASSVANDIGYSALGGGTIGAGVGALTGTSALAGAGIGALGAGLATGAGLGGYALGNYLDNKFNLSGKLANFVWDMLN